MLAIGEGQLAAMNRQWRSNLAWKFTLMLRDSWPQEIASLTRDEALRRVTAEMDRGLAVGLRAQHDLLMFIQLAVILGWDYRAGPGFGWIDRMMNDGTLGLASRRLRLVLARLDARP